MDSGIKPAFRAKICGQAVTVHLSKGDLVDPLKALEMGQPGDVIVVDAGGDPNTSVCGGLMGVTVVPLDKAAAIVKAARGQPDREEETRKWLAKGKTVEDLLNEFGRIWACTDRA